MFTAQMRYLKLAMVVAVLSLVAVGCSSADPTPAPAAAVPAGVDVGTVSKLIDDAMSKATKPLTAAEIEAIVKAAVPAQKDPLTSKEIEAIVNASLPTPTPVVAAPKPTATAVPVVQPKFGGIATFGQRRDPRRGWVLSGSLTETPVLQAIGGSGNMVGICRSTPTSIAEQWTHCPRLATSWEANSDFTQWTFQLRDDVVWHDGVPLTAEAMKQVMDFILFGYKERGKDRTASQWGHPFVGSVEALDGNKVRVNLTQSVPAYASLLALDANTMIYPPHKILAEIDAGNTKVAPIDVGVIGVGPFKLDEYIKRTKISVRKFGAYWQKDEAERRLPYLDGIDFALFYDRDAVMAAFRAGQIEMTVRGTGFQLLIGVEAILKKQFGDEVVVFLGDSSGGDGGMIFNTIDKGPWSDVRVRQALTMVYDRQAWINVRTTGKGKAPFRALFPKGSDYNNADFETWPGWNQATKAADLAAAKKLMADAGYPTGFSTTYTARGAERVPAAEFHVDQMAKLGIKAAIDVVDQTTYDDRLCSKSFQVTDGVSPKTRVPGLDLNILMSFDVNPCGGAAKHQDANVDAQLKALAGEAPGPGLNKLAQAFEKYVLSEQVLFISNVNYKEYFHRSYLKPHHNFQTVSRTQIYHDCAFCWIDK
jgi:peptide/nickel transport system substrate-binding protein